MVSAKDNSKARTVNVQLAPIQFQGSITVVDGRRDSMDQIVQKIAGATRAGLIQGVSTVFD